MRLPPPEGMLIPLAATLLDLAYVADVRCLIDADHRDQQRDLFYLHCAAATRGGSDLPRLTCPDLSHGTLRACGIAVSALARTGSHISLLGDCSILISPAASSLSSASRASRIQVSAMCS